MLSPLHDPLRPAAPVLTVDDVTLRYRTARGPVVAVENAAFSVARGERIALVGPSGCGKSSLLRAIGGFLTPSTGRVALEGGEFVTGPSPERMMVFQEFDQLLPWHTVLGNVRFALQAANGVKRRNAEMVARLWIDRVGLTRFADAYPHTLSGGMKQRVAIGRALRSPAGDPADGRALRRARCAHPPADAGRAAEAVRGDAATVIFVTHDIDEAIRISTRVLAMTPHPGRIAAQFATGSAGPAALERDIRHVVHQGRSFEHAGEAAYG